MKDNIGRLFVGTLVGALITQLVMSTITSRRFINEGYDIPSVDYKIGATRDVHGYITSWELSPSQTSGNYCRAAGISEEDETKQCETRFGNEWRRDGLSTCTGWLGGYATRCKKFQYTADVKTCCITGGPTSGRETCDPDWLNPASDTCKVHVKTYCESQPDMFLTDEKCMLLAREDPAWKTQQYIKYCNIGDNFGKPECQSFCFSPEGSRQCDVGAMAFCGKNPTHSSCSCIKSPYNQEFNPNDPAAFQYNPICVDSNCINTGYQTNNMIQARGDQCPDIINCEQAIQIMDVGGNVTAPIKELAQRCGNKSDPQDPYTQDPDPVDQTAPPPATSVPSSKTYYTKYDQDEQPDWLLIGGIGGAISLFFTLLIIAIIL